MRRAVFESEVGKNKEEPYRYTVAKLRKNQLGMPNWHERLEVLFGIKGESRVWLNGREYIMKEGDTVIANSEIIHTVSSFGCDAAFGMIHINTVFFKENGMDLSHMSFREYISGDTALLTMMKNVADLSAADGDLKQARIRKALLELIICLYDNYRTEANRGNTTAAFDRVREAMRYVRANLASPLSLDGVAAAVNINKYQLEKEFKSVAGVTVFEFINTVRCEEAKRLITEGAAISEAAFICGYKNLSYFTRTYKRLTGELPSSAKRTLNEV